MAETYPESVRAKRRKFRDILARDAITVMPGGFSPVYAMAAEAAGFDCFFISGSQMSAYLLGAPDIGIIGLRDVVDHARHMAARTNIPLMLDTDTAFGNVVNAHYTVKEVVQSGVAGLQIEDQVAPKKSGAGDLIHCVPLDEAVGKYRAAVAARDEADPDFVICARSFAMAAEGGGFDDVVARAQAYVEEGGVDFVWLNGVKDPDQIVHATKAIPAPVLIGGDGGENAPTLKDYEAMGVRILLYPTQIPNAALQGAWHALKDLKERGPQGLADIAARADDCPWGRSNLRKLLDYETANDIEARFLSGSGKDEK